MQSINRRSFAKTGLAGAAVAAAGAAFTPTVLATEDVNDVQFAKDPKNPQPGLEAAHTPLILVEKVDSKAVAYGKTPAGDFYRVTVQARHEATREHHIFGVALHVNGVMVAQHSMSQTQAEASLPAVTFVQRLKAGEELLAITTCNVHGKWGSRATV